MTLHQLPIGQSAIITKVVRNKFLFIIHPVHNILSKYLPNQLRQQGS